MKEISKESLKKYIDSGAKVKIEKKPPPKPKDNTLVTIATIMGKAVIQLVDMAKNLNATAELNKSTMDNVLTELRKPEQPREKRETHYKIIKKKGEIDSIIAKEI